MKLKVIAHTYIRKIRPKAQAEIGWFAQQPSLDVAIEKAALAINRKGQRYSHQRRLKKAALKQAYRALIDESGAIGQAEGFDELFRIIRAAVKPIPGIGELYVYDTSLRIGARLNLFPTKVYLHAGTRLGARALDLDDGAATLTISALPKELRVLEPHELEDVLCIFKDELKTASAMPMTEDMANRSWCN